MSTEFSAGGQEPSHTGGARLCEPQRKKRERRRRSRN